MAEKEAALTPMMRQFYELKAKHPDAVLLFRCGDFYETYCSDAVVASEILGITLTKRSNGKSDASKAIEMAGITPKVQPIRGGTDGANLSFMGLPCPNIFAGGHNFHGKMEYVPLESMEKASKVILNIISLYAE